MEREAHPVSKQRCWRDKGGCPMGNFTKRKRSIRNKKEIRVRNLLRKRGANEGGGAPKKKRFREKRPSRGRGKIKKGHTPRHLVSEQ